jgi:hypothetical protein
MSFLSSSWRSAFFLFFLFYIVFAVKYSLFGESTMEETLVCEEEDMQCRE